MFLLVEMVPIAMGLSKKHIHNLDDTFAVGRPHDSSPRYALLRSDVSHVSLDHVISNATATSRPSGQSKRKNRQRNRSISS